MDMVCKSGKMEPNTKVIGDLIKHVVMENFGMSMVMSSKVNGLMTKLMDMASTFIRMELGMRVNGKMIYSTAKEKKYGLIIPDTKALTMRAKKHGVGLYIWQDGSSYNGDWFENRIEGHGVYKWKDGRTYTG